MSVRVGFFLLVAMCSPTLVNSAYAQTDVGNGLVAYESTFGFSATVERIEPAVKERGLFLMRMMDHAAAAAQMGRELSPNTVALFGNPQVGSQVMTCAPTAGIDLPQRLHVWSDGGTVIVAYNDPDWLKQRHRIAGCDEILSGVRETLDSIALEVAGLSNRDGHD